MAKTASASRSGRETAVFRNFLGVDFTSSPLQVSPRRSPQAVNLIADGGHGQNCKRHGWEQVSDLPLGADGTPRRANGMWRFDDGRISCLLVHAGDALYRADEREGSYELICEGISDERSQGFAFGGRMYFVGMGRYYVFGTWNEGASYKLRPVEECDDVYVPTTTAAIGPIGSDSEAGVTVEAVNRLTRWRINTLVGSSTAGASYRLDGNPWANTWRNLQQMCVEIEYMDEEENIWKKTFTPDVDNHGSTGSGAWIYPLTSNDGARAGEIMCSLNGALPAVLTLDNAYPPPTPDAPNITVRFITWEKTDGEAASVIGNCRFGAVFGAGGNANRLFLAGNPVCPNRQFWCEIGDPTYFPDVNACVVGSSAVPITGMMRLSDGVLAVFKADTGQEPTIYYQRAEEDVSGTITGGNLPLTLYTTAGNVGEAMISRFACADLYGDPLILSRNGVFGITMRANVATGDRYAVERSHFIQKRLCAEELSEAAAIVCGGRYYLSVGGRCYVADAEYRATPPGGSHYQYEWWYWENVPARVFCEFDGVLWFGTADGRICRFTDGFLDTTFERFSEGQMLVEEDRVSVSVSAALDLRVGDRIRSESRRTVPLGPFIARGGEAYRIETVDPDATAYIGRMIDEGAVVMLETTRELIPIKSADRNGNPIPVIPAGTRFTVTDIEFTYNCYTFKVYYADGSGGWEPSDYYPCTDFSGTNGTVFYEVGDGDFLIVTDMPSGGEELYVRSVAETEDGYVVQLSEAPGGDAYTFPEEDTERHLVQGKIYRDIPVYAEWYTPVVDLGSGLYEKTLLRLSTVCEPGLGGRMEVGYETRRTERAGVVRRVDGGESGRLDLADLDFSDFSFDSFAASHTVRICERHVNYVRLRVRSEGAVDLRMHEMSLVYRIDRACRGTV